MILVKNLRFAILLFATLSFNVAASEITGNQLARQVFDRNTGRDSVASAQMVLVNQKGKKRIRHFTSKRIEENGLQSQLTRFTSPADIEGTGFLTLEKPGWKTEQFLYLPALKRTRRIVSSQKSHKFVNSDFTYEDLERHPVDDYIHKITGAASMGNIECHVLESRPKQGVESQYSLTVSLIAKQALLPVQVKYFDKKNQHIKTYKVLKLDKIQGIWTEVIVSMEDHKKRHKTYLKQEKISYNTNLDTADISRENLEMY